MDRLPFLKEVFPFHTEAEIVTIIEIVNEANPNITAEQQVDIVFDMLNGSPMHGDVRTTASSTQSMEEGAVGFGHVVPVNMALLTDHFNNLKIAFPDVSSEFLWDFCLKKGIEFNLDDSLDEITRGVSHGVPVNSRLTHRVNQMRRKFPNVAPPFLWNFWDFWDDALDEIARESNVTWERLKDALPKWDPSYLKEQAEKLVLENKNLEDFINDAIDATDYPTIDEYLIREREKENLNSYKEEHFKLEKFLKFFPDPEHHFNDSNRPNPLEQDNVPDDDLLYAKTFLYNRYPGIRKRHVDLVFKMKKMRLIDCCDILDKTNTGLKTKRNKESMPDSQNLGLLQEVIFLKQRRQISRVLRDKDESYQKCKSQARALGLLEKCGAFCGEEELIPEECFNCQKGCMFCKDCVKRYVEVKMGDGLYRFPCCGDCDSEFSLHTLQMALPEHMFERLLLKVQSDEIIKANVDGLATCPFCDFASIPPATSTIFKCENSECLKESCRLCMHESHIPQRCNEIEYDEDVKRRTYIENKMFEALVRTCNNCKKKFVKSTGCNRMTCNCGSTMCYVCSQTITGYDHFKDATACPLFTDDAQNDLIRVQQQAELAKQELGNVEIKFDPAVGIADFFHYKTS